MGGGVAALDLRNEACDLCRSFGLFRRRTRHGDIARHALLQQKLGRLNDRFGMEARAHRAVMQRVGDGDENHRLVMRHIGAHDGDLGAFRKARARVVERLIPAVGAARAEAGHALKVARRGRGSIMEASPLA